MSVADELLKLQRLHQSGAIDADEFAEAKARLLSSPPPLKNALSSSRLSDTDDETWALLLHLSQFAGYAVPLAGLIVPILNRRSRPRSLDCARNDNGSIPVSDPYSFNNVQIKGPSGPIIYTLFAKTQLLNQSFVNFFVFL